MNQGWIRKEGGDRLLVFLNGWGMDGRLFDQAPVPAGWDVVMFHNYVDIGPAADVTESYDHVVMVAWSMGVWAAGGAFRHLADRIDRSVAINGTACPIHDRYGIPPAFYSATEENYSAGTRESFYRRMCHTGDRLRRFLAAQPLRSIEDQARELTAIRERAEDSGSAEPCPPVAHTTHGGRDSVEPFADHAYPFDEAIIGAQDRIMRARNQQRFWEGKATCRTIDMPHYPFFDITWEEILGDAADT